MHDLRSTRNFHASHTVTESIGPQAGHVILNDFHLVALEVGGFEQGDFMFLAILQVYRNNTL